MAVVNFANEISIGRLVEMAIKKRMGGVLRTLESPLLEEDVRCVHASLGRCTVMLTGVFALQSGRSGVPTDGSPRGLGRRRNSAAAAQESAKDGSQKLRLRADGRRDSHDTAAAHPPQAIAIAWQNSPCLVGANKNTNVLFFLPPLLAVAKRTAADPPKHTHAAWPHSRPDSRHDACRMVIIRQILCGFLFLLEKQWQRDPSGKT